MRNILGFFGKVIVGMVAVGTAAAFATAYFAGKAGQETRERIDESVDRLKGQAQETLDTMTGQSGTPATTA